MRDRTAIVKNISTLLGSYNDTKERNSGEEGMIGVYGRTGAGKTTAIAYLINKLKNDGDNPIWVEASPSWSLRSMLADICRACEIEPKGSSSDLVAMIKEQMMTGRPLFVDEVDHMFLPGAETTLRMVEQIRALYDASKVPVVLIGMDKLRRKIRTREQLDRRITQWVEFVDLDADDIRTVANTLVEIPVADCFLDFVIEKAGSRVGWIVPALAQAERRAKGNGWPEITLENGATSR